MRQMSAKFLFVALLLVAPIGCEPPADPAPPTPAEPAPTDTGTPLGPASPDEVAIMDGAGYQELLSQQLGKVVLVDYWASW